MKAVHKAVFVDIGSNSIRSMTAQTGTDGFVFSEKKVITTRLAAGLNQSGLLSEDRVHHSMDVLSSIQTNAKREQLPVYCYATSAVRDADNGRSFVSQVKATLCLDIDVLSCAEEARLALLGATGGIGALLDIGGGSAQIVSPTLSYSAPCGCVRAKDLAKECPPDEMERLLVPWLSSVFLPSSSLCESNWTGVGGTITTLAAFDLGLEAYDPMRVSGHILTKQCVRILLDHLYALGTRRKQSPLLATRHDTILQGGTVLLYIMNCCKIETLRASDADGLEGFAMEILQYPINIL